MHNVDTAIIDIAEGSQDSGKNTRPRQGCDSRYDHVDICPSLIEGASTVWNQCEHILPREKQVQDSCNQ